MSRYRKGDKVYHPNFGWGEVISIGLGNFPIEVQFNINVSFTIDGKYKDFDRYPSLSFAEYDYVNGGFSNERKN